MDNVADGVVEIQVKVPVCLTLRLSRDDAESMNKEELCRVVDEVLDALVGGTGIDLQNVSDRHVKVRADCVPAWDRLPDDECELVVTEEGLFPGEDEDYKATTIPQE